MLPTKLLPLRPSRPSLVVGGRTFWPFILVVRMRKQIADIGCMCSGNWSFEARTVAPPDADVPANSNELRDYATLRVPISNHLDRAAVMRFREFRDRILEQVKGTIHHDC